ncbi:MAG: FAD-dependent oxidoreductase, partial [Gammaproteobacteria bacterium]|nr:FAD-dependent oxidoreductase [Gammaproteobacteria bacterium]
MDDRVKTVNHTLVMGGGLAGLSTAHALTKAHYPVTVIEADKSVGGLARTIEHNGFRFDLGGHRFVTNDQELDTFVRSILNEDCLIVPRSSKILLRNRYFDYPLKPFKALSAFGPKMS